MQGAASKGLLRQNNEDAVNGRLNKFYKQTLNPLTNTLPRFLDGSYWYPGLEFFGPKYIGLKENIKPPVCIGMPVFVSPHNILQTISFGTAGKLALNSIYKLKN